MRAPAMRGDLSPVDLCVLAAVQKPARIRAVAELVNDGRPGWDTISDADVRALLAGLVDRRYVTQKAGGWWHRTHRGRL